MTIDDDGWFDIGSDHNLMFWDSIRRTGDNGSEGAEKGRATQRCEKSIWTWKRKGKVNWTAYKEKVEEKLELFGDDMVSERKWTAEERYCVFMKYLQEAADESLEKVYGGRMFKKPRTHAWWDDEVKEAIRRRKEACRVHRKFSRLRKSFPGAISSDMVEEKWAEYLEMKQIAKELVAQKRRKERDEVLDEFRKSGGYGSSYFWKKVKKGSVKGIKRLRDLAGKVVVEDTKMAGIAKDYFENNGKQTLDFVTDDNIQWEPQHREKLE